MLIFLLYSMLQNINYNGWMSKLIELKGLGEFSRLGNSNGLIRCLLGTGQYNLFQVRTSLK